MKIFLTGLILNSSQIYHSDDIQWYELRIITITEHLFLRGNYEIIIKLRNGKRCSYFPESNSTLNEIVKQLQLAKVEEFLRSKPEIVVKGSVMGTRFNEFKIFKTRPL